MVISITESLKKQVTEEFNNKNYNKVIELTEKILYEDPKDSITLEFRKKSLISDVVLGIIAGFGKESYFLALDAAITHLSNKPQ